MTSRDVWTAAEIADWLRLSQRHVAERLVHEKGFPKPILPGPHRRKRWLRVEIEQWAGRPR